MLTQVMDLRSGEYIASYTLESIEAVIAAYAYFEQDDANTWQYEGRYYELLSVGRYSVTCGDYTALLQESI